MNIGEELMTSSPEELSALKSIMDNITSVCILLVIIAVLAFVVWLVKRKQKEVQNNMPKVFIQRTAFAGNFFGVMYDVDDMSETILHYAIICNGQGEELCRYEEAEGQVIKGFSSENGNLYMHTLETYEDGTMAPVKWMFVPEHNELVECD